MEISKEELQALLNTAAVSAVSAFAQTSGAKVNKVVSVTGGSNEENLAVQRVYSNPKKSAKKKEYAKIQSIEILGTERVAKNKDGTSFPVLNIRKNVLENGKIVQKEHTFRAYELTQ